MDQEHKKSNGRPAAGQAVPVVAEALARPTVAQPTSRRSSANPQPAAMPRKARPLAEPVAPPAAAVARRAKPLAAKKPAPARKPRSAAATKRGVLAAPVAGGSPALEPPVAAVTETMAPLPVEAAVFAPSLPTSGIDETPRFELSDSELRDRISRRATEIWLSHGGSAQGPIEDWLQAEAEVRRTLEVVASF